MGAATSPGPDRGPPSARKHASGVFISFEGGDGAGKSTQIAMLADALREAGRDVVVTREPGGAPGAEAIRKLLVEGAADRWSPMAEALLMYAARADHLQRTILPALEAGAVVLTDRFADSTMAYQGLAGALGAAAVERLHGLVVGTNDPDLTLILDLPPEEGLARAGARPGGGTESDGSGAGAESRFENKGAAYQGAVRAAFLKIAADNPDRCAVIDASGPAGEVAARIRAAVRARLPSLGPASPGLPPLGLPPSG